MQWENRKMKQYKLLTPGPLTTTETVKKEMMFDHCTWDNDYKEITQEIRAGLLKLAHVDEDTYTAILMQGSGTFGVESVLTSSVGTKDKLLIAANGAYGERMEDIAKHAGAGTLVPITGFANAMVSPALEFKREERVIITPSQKCRCFRRVC